MALRCSDSGSPYKPHIQPSSLLTLQVASVGLDTMEKITCPQHLRFLFLRYFFLKAVK